jgi:hypothetical protein
MRSRRSLYLVLAVLALLALARHVYNRARIGRAAELTGVPPERVRLAMGASLLAGAWFSILTPEGEKAALVSVAADGVLVDVFLEAGWAPEAERARDGSVLWEKTAAGFVSRYWPSERGRLHALAPPVHFDGSVKLELRSDAGRDGVTYKVFFHKHRVEHVERRPPK